MLIYINIRMLIFFSAQVINFPRKIKWFYFPKENKMVLFHFKLCAITVIMPFIPDNASKNCQL